MIFMANINAGNNGQMKENVKVNKPIRHDWSFDKVANKDLNGNQWPFKVTRDAGKQTKMVCRSITDLNKSFEGTPYNLNNCPVVKSRYTLLYEVLRDRYGNILNKITHLYLTLDTVYFMTSDNPEVKYFTYAPNPLTVNDAQGIVNGLLYKSGSPIEIIKERFNSYKETNNEYIKNQLIKDVREYIDCRKSMKVLDYNKYLIDVLKSELTFSSLKYLFFAPIPQMARDYQGCLLKILQSRNINPYSSEKLCEELEKVINNKAEKIGVKLFVEGLEKQEYYRSIVKVFYENNITDISPEYVKKVFLSSVKPEYLDNNVYISEAEKMRKESKVAKDAEENEKIQEYVDSANNIKESIKNTYSDILDMLVIMNVMTKFSDEIHKKGLEINNVEYGIWINQYDIITMKSRIQAVFEHRREKDEEGSPVLVELYPISKIFAEVQEKIGMKNSLDWKLELKYFYENIRPSYFSNETLGLEKFNISKLNIDVSSIDSIKEVVSNLQNLESIMENIKNNFMFLTEVVLGVHYATFGKFMSRYGTDGVVMTKMLIPDLVTKYSLKSFNTTKHVRYSGKLAFYTIQLGIENLKNYDSKTVSSVSDPNGIGNLANFIDRYLEAISEKEVEDLKHTNKDEKYSNLIAISRHVDAILETCRGLVHLDVNISENITNRYNALMEDMTNKVE